MVEIIYMSRSVRKRTLGHVRPARIQLSLLFAQSDKSLCCPYEETMHPWYSKCMQGIFLSEYAGWFESSLVEHVRRHISWTRWPRWLSWIRVGLVIRRLRVRPSPDRQRSFLEIGREIFSTVILSRSLIQDGQVSVSGDTMGTTLVNHLED